MARAPVAAAAFLLLLGSLSAAATPGAAPRTLMDPVAQRPTQFLEPGAPTPPPDGPALPTIQDGIGPGSGLQQRAEAGGEAGFLCTGAFLLRDPATATYYLSTAGHCLVRDELDPTPYTGAANPDKVDQEIDICVSGCLDNALGVGTYVQLVAGPGYAPVAYAESGGPGQDFGLIQIPPDRHSLLRPWMPQFGGPTGAAETRSGDTLVHYGHGTYCCPAPVGGAASRTPADQGRVATSLGPTSLFGAPEGTTFSAVGSSSGGDSGAGVAIGLPDPARGVQGGPAVGVLTHGIEVNGIPYFEGTTLAHGLAMVRAATGLRLELVLEDDALSTVPRPPPAGRIAILDPADGATVRPGGDGTVPIRGTAGIENGTLPAGALVQVAIDDAAFAPASRLPVTGNATWSAQWDLHGVAPGRHTLHARLVDADGVALATLNRTVTVAAAITSPPGGGGPSGSPPGTPGSTATGGATGGPAGKGTSPSQKSPVPILAAAAGLLAAATLLRRRR